MPPEHPWGHEHMLPHPPQLFGSDVTSTHPPQSWKSACLKTRRRHGQYQIGGRRLVIEEPTRGHNFMRCSRL